VGCGRVDIGGRVSTGGLPNAVLRCYFSQVVSYRMLPHVIVWNCRTNQESVYMSECKFRAILEHITVPIWNHVLINLVDYCRDACVYFESRRVDAMISFVSSNGKSHDALRTYFVRVRIKYVHSNCSASWACDACL